MPPLSVTPQIVTGWWCIERLLNAMDLQNGFMGCKLIGHPLYTSDPNRSAKWIHELFSSCCIAHNGDPDLHAYVQELAKLNFVIPRIS